MAKPILHPSDFSPASRPAFRKAIDLARRMRRPLVLAHVTAPPALLMGDGYVPAQVWDQAERSIRAGADKGLRRLMAQARAHGVRATTMVLEGSPAEGLAVEQRPKMLTNQTNNPVHSSMEGDWACDSS